MIESLNNSNQKYNSKKVLKLFNSKLILEDINENKESYRDSININQDTITKTKKSKSKPKKSSLKRPQEDKIERVITEIPSSPSSNSFQKKHSNMPTLPSKHYKSKCKFTPF